MNDVNGTLHYKGKDYTIVFNLNVMEAIQEEYGTIDAWGELTDGTTGGEPNAKAVIFGFTQMINEGLEIEADENGTEYKPMTLKQIGRMITEVGLGDAAKVMNETVVDSTKGESKNG